ncbi:zinc-binding dehydrogenase [Streptomyces sp. Act-28]
MGGVTTVGQHSAVRELLERSHRLGSDPRNTNYAGGNASAKGTDTDPVTGGDVELMWVKGSGGDLGTLTGTGLAVLRLDRLRALTDVYPGVDREDEMVAAFDYCLHGKGGAAPSIDTAMHGLVDAAHVDHLHPDSGIALACAADGEKLTAECFGDRVVWVPWRRPGFQLGLDIAAVKEATGGRGADVVYDPVGGPAYAASAKCVAFEGRIVVVGFASGDIPAPALNHALVKNYAILGLHWGLYGRKDPAAVRRCHDVLAEHAAKGLIKPLVSERVPFAAAAGAARRVAEGTTTGRLVVLPGGPEGATR